MTGFHQIMDLMGRRILDYADCPLAWVYALPPSCSMLRTLDDAWNRLPNMVAALEVGHAVLADQDDFDIDGVSLTLSKETIAMLDNSAATLMGLDTWAPHPAAPGTHDFIDIMLKAFREAAKYHTPAYQAYLRDETIVLYCPALRDALTRYLMSITVLVQAESDRYLLTLHAATHLIVHKQALAHLLRTSCTTFRAFAHAHHYGAYYRKLQKHFHRAKSKSRPLSWHDPVTGWTIPLADQNQRPDGQRIHLRSWALQNVQLQLVGHTG